MADKKFSQLGAVVDIDDADDFALERSGQSKRITGADLKAAVGNGGSSSLLAAPFDLSAADIKASTETPATIIAAQGANTLVVPETYVYRYTFVTTPYGVGDIHLIYGDEDLNVLLNILSSAESIVGWTHGTLSAGIGEAGPVADYLNQPVRLSAALRGEILEATINTPGSGYAVGDTGIINDGSADATYVVDSVDGAGVILTFTITDGGDGYSESTPWETTPGGSQPGAGSGFTVSITSVDAAGATGDGILSGVIYYRVVDLT